MSNEELVLETPPLAIQVQIISEVNRQRAAGLVADAKAMKVCSVEDFKKAGEYMNSLGRMRVFLESTIKNAREPFVAQANKYSEEGKPFVEMVKGGEATLNAEMLAFDRLQKEEARKAEAERQRLAEQARKEQAAAAAAVEAAKDEKEFNEAEDLFKGGLETEQQAKEIVVPQVYKPTGAATKKTAVIETFDLSKLPLVYHMIDEAKVKKAILANIIDLETPGIKFRIDEGFRGTGR